MQIRGTMQSPLKPELASLIPQEGLVLILGDIRMGKSCLGYGILETVENKGKYVYGLPQEKRHLLPESIEPIDTQEFPEGGAVLCDEAYISFYARSSMAAANKFMDLFAGLVGQKAILGIYVSQLSRKLDIGVVSAAKLLLVKCPSVLQMRLDRSELRDILRDAWNGFKALKPPEGLSKVDWQKHCVYALCNDFEGMIEASNSPPSFWSDDLSRAFAGVSLSQQGQEKQPSRKTAEEETATEWFVRSPESLEGWCLQRSYTMRGIMYKIYEKGGEIRTIEQEVKNA